VDPGSLLVLGGLLAVTFGTRLLQAWMRRDRRIKRALKRVRATPVAEVRDGRVVKLVGEVVSAGRSLEAPLTQKACAYYSISVEEYQVQTLRRATWREVLREERGVDFYLRDESGIALVHVTERSTFAALLRDRKARASPVLYSDAELERLLSARGHATRGAIFRKHLRASECVLQAGERVAVGGLGRWLPDPEAAGGSYRELPKRLVLQASEAIPLFMSDDPATL
jgi:hypothetical protein